MGWWFLLFSFATQVPWQDLNQALKESNWQRFDQIMDMVNWRRLKGVEKRQALYWWGLAYFAQGRYDLACELFRKALKVGVLPPSDQVRLYFGLFKCHLKKGEKSQAQHYLLKLEKHFPQDVWTHRAQLEWAWQR